MRCVTWHGYDTPLLFGEYPKYYGLDVELLYASNDDQMLETARNDPIDVIGGAEAECGMLFG